jgi:hypothetical protein
MSHIQDIRNARDVPGDAVYAGRLFYKALLYISHLSMHLSHPRYPGYVALLKMLEC